MQLDLRREINLDVGEDRHIVGRVEYLWFLVKCSQGKDFGHLSSALFDKKEIRWQPKPEVKKYGGVMSKQGEGMEDGKLLV